MLKSYKTSAVLLLIYGSKMWVTSKKIGSRRQGQGMKFLRRVKKCSSQDKIRNEDIRIILQIFSLKEYIEQSRSRWNEYVERMTEERLLIKATK